MATNLLNRAQISYTFNGTTGSAVSNQTNTTLLDQYTMLVTKETQTPELRAGNNAAYVIRVENNGAGTISGISVFDDLGMAADETTAPLTYVEDSAAFYVDGTEVQGTAEVSPDGGVTFTTTATLAPEENLLIFYLAELSAEVTVPITNTATVTANTDATAAAVITGSDSAIVTPVAVAELSIFKTADKDTVVEGDTLTYTFMLMNTGFNAAEGVTLTDEFPAEFNVTSVSYTAGGATTPVAPSDYTITAQNTLTLPAEVSILELSVPAATEAGPGVMTITVTGTVSGATTIE